MPAGLRRRRHAGVPPPQPERPRADHRRRRIHSLGIECDRPLSRGEASRRTCGRPIRGCGPKPTSGWTGPTRSGRRFAPAFLGFIRTPPEKRNEAAIAESLRKTGELLQLVDDHLRSRPYLAGDEFTVGDIPLGCGIWRWMAMPIERPARPHVGAVVRTAGRASGLPEDRDVAADLKSAIAATRTQLMGKGRLEAFSDGVIAIIITIMVLEMKVPHGDELAALQPLIPVLRQLRAELRLRRHLLEQPSPHAARCRESERGDALGEPAPAVLAVAHSVRHGLDGREPFRADAGRACTAPCCCCRPSLTTS